MIFLLVEPSENNEENSASTDDDDEENEEIAGKIKIDNKFLKNISHTDVNYISWFDLQMMAWWRKRLNLMTLRKGKSKNLKTFKRF